MVIGITRHQIVGSVTLVSEIQVPQANNAAIDKVQGFATSEILHIRHNSLFTPA